MSTISFELCPELKGELAAMAASGDVDKMRMAALILQLIGLIKSNPDIHDRLLENVEVDIFDSGGKHKRIDIKLIKELAVIAGDSKFLTDAVRRLRCATGALSNVRIFYARNTRCVGSKGESYVALGFASRDIAYSEFVLSEIKKRYLKYL